MGENYARLTHERIGIGNVARILGAATKSRPRKRARKAKTGDDTITLGLAVDGAVSVTRDQLRAESEVPKTAQQSCVLGL